MLNTRRGGRRSGDLPWDWESARPRCLREARRFVRTPAEAEDAVQEAFIRAWRKRANFRREEEPLPWLLQITRREALRITARRNAHPEVELESVPQALLPALEHDPPLDTLDVRRLLEGLEPDERTLLELRYEDDLTQGQVADRLGIPEGTVKVRLHRLRKRLRLELESP